MTVNIHLSESGVEVLSVRETSIMCSTVVSRVFTCLQGFLGNIPNKDKSFVQECHQCILQNLELFSSISPEYSKSETLQPIEIHDITCTIMNQGQSVSLLVIDLDPLKIDHMGPFAIIKILAATIDITLRSLSRKIPFSTHLRHAEICIQNVNIMVENVHKLLSRRFRDREYLVNTTTVFPSIIFHVEREKQKLAVMDCTLKPLNSSTFNKC